MALVHACRQGGICHAVRHCNSHRQQHALRTVAPPRVGARKSVGTLNLSRLKYSQQVTRCSSTSQIAASPSSALQSPSSSISSWADYPAKQHHQSLEGHSVLCQCLGLFQSLQKHPLHHRQKQFWSLPTWPHQSCLQCESSVSPNLNFSSSSISLSSCSMCQEWEVKLRR